MNVYQRLNGLYLPLDEFIDQFLGLSDCIAEAIISDENMERVRQLDEQISDVFNSILALETSNQQESQKKAHFLIVQIVDSEDFNTRRQLAEHLKKHNSP